jgi:hypothetical protein
VTRASNVFGADGMNASVMFGTSQNENCWGTHRQFLERVWKRLIGKEL